MTIGLMGGKTLGLPRDPGGVVGIAPAIEPAADGIVAGPEPLDQSRVDDGHARRFRRVFGLETEALCSSKSPFSEWDSHELRSFTNSCHFSCHCRVLRKIAAAIA
jgi:hypothetical protein